MHEIEPADPRARRRAALLLLSGVLAGLVIVWLARSYGPTLEAWINRDPEQTRSRLKLALTVLAIAIDLPVLGLAAYFWRLGVRMIRTERFPAPRTLVMRDTPVLRGAPARRRGRLMQIVAVLLASAVLGLTIVLRQLASLLDSQGP